jgi:hypothetical protein
MGTRSDVGLAMKTKIADEAEKLHPWILAEAEVLQHEAGNLYVFRDIRWYEGKEFLKIEDSLGDVARFVEWLEKQDSSMYLLVEACFNYPNDDDVKGSWNDNPWNLHSRISVELLYNEVE